MAALVRIWRYILLVSDRFGPEDLVARLLAAVGEDGKEEIMTAGEMLMERGREKGLRQGIESLCEVLGIDLSAVRRAELDHLDAAGLDALLARLKATRAWS